MRGKSLNRCIARCSSALPTPEPRSRVDRLNNRTTVREIVRGIAKSPEHLQRFGNQARENVVVDVYRHLLNRGPDAEGLKNAVNLVSRRGVQPLIDQIVDSQEYRQQFGDWTVPGSSVRFCVNGEQPGQQSSNAPGNGNSMRFRRMDANSDGVIARTEWRGNAQYVQQLRLEQRRPAVRRRSERRSLNGAATGTVRIGKWPATTASTISISTAMDTWTRNEWDGGQNAFDRLDTNDDRRLTRGEFNTSNNSSASNFARVDMNGDGRIRLDEWPWSHTSFDRQDTNRDGVISRGEYRGAPQAFGGSGSVQGGSVRRPLLTAYGFSAR